MNPEFLVFLSEKQRYADIPVFYLSANEDACVPKSFICLCRNRKKYVHLHTQI